MKKYFKNIIEQDHLFMKKRIRNILGLTSLQTAKKIIVGIKVMHIIKKGQAPKGACPKTDISYP
ncbi:DDE-type integrase/transposase/recombinase [Bacillus cereus]|nr:DDE-type integrase/transposase/recombinase [Bacillus cereus]MDF9612867.1 DDE-type integrase/transposase/recombinase [Bacillus cereus]